MKVIDAVCPLVTRVHNEAKKYHRDGKKILLVGHRGHQEVRGTMGQVEMNLIGDEPGTVEVYRISSAELLGVVDVGRQAGGLAFWKME